MTSERSASLGILLSPDLCPVTNRHLGSLLEGNCEPEFLGELSALLAQQHQQAALRHDCAKLLVLVGNAGRQRDYMPMDMRVALSTAEAQHVHPIGRHGNLQS